MANYLLLYSGGSMPQSEAEQAAVMQAWTGWFGALGSALVDGGNPTTGQAKTIASDGTVSDGSSLGLTSGHSIINTDSPHQPLPPPHPRPAFHSAAHHAV